MANYKLSNVAKEDLIRIHQYGVQQFGLNQADKYFDDFFVYFDLIANKQKNQKSFYIYKLYTLKIISNRFFN